MRSLTAVLAALATLGLAPAGGAARESATELGGTPRAPGASAKHVPASFLGKDPHGPLAKVVEGAVATPEAGACTSWGVVGARWKALDRFGQVVGTAKITELDRYDVSGCDELTLEKTDGESGVGLFVRGDYVPAQLQRVDLGEAVKKDLAALIERRDARVPDGSHGLPKKPDLPLDARMIAFRREGGETIAMVGGRAMTILRLDGGRWVTEHERLATAEEVWEEPDIFMPIGVLDMNGDGRAEIVVHERYIDGYSDFTFTRDEAGRWSEIAAGIWGAFA